MPEIADVAVLDKVAISLAPRDNDPAKFNGDIADEFSQTNIEPLTPMKGAIVILVKEGFNQPQIEHNFYNEMQQEMAYFSRTRDLEIGSERTNFLEQRIIDPLMPTLESQGVSRPRIVIMRKGEEPEAFVMPDGTIFLSQSLINSLDTIDEIGGVVAHELGHLINRTFNKKVEANQASKMGVGWLHEAASDMGAQALLERANLNSYAFGDAIKKIARVSRDIEHQTGLIRAVEVNAMHSAINFSTSNKTPEKITDHHQSLYHELTPTNLELLNVAITTGNKERFLEGIAKLHPKDLEKIYKTGYFRQSHLDRSFINASLAELVSKRLHTAGYSDAEIAGFLIYTGGLLSKVNFPNSEMVSQLGDFFTRDDRDIVHYRMYREIFQNRFSSDEPTVLTYVNYLKSQMFIEGTEYPGRIMPITEEVLLDTLYKVTHVELPADKRSYKHTIESVVKDCLFVYIKQKYGVMQDTVNIPVAEITPFLEKVKQKDIPIFNYFNKEIENPELISLFKQILLPPEVRLKVGFQDIDAFFELIDDPEFSRGDFAKKLTWEVHQLNEYFNQESITDSKRGEYISYIFNKIDQLQNISVDRSILATLSPDKAKSPGEQGREYNDALVRFNLKMIYAANVFEKDGEEYYRYLNQAMVESNIPFEDLSFEQLINISQGLLESESDRSPHFISYLQEGSGGSLAFHHKAEWGVTDFTKFSELPLIRAAINKQEHLNFSNIAELNNHVITLLREAVIDSQANTITLPYKGMHFGLYETSIKSLIFGKGIRKEFIRLLNQGVPVGEYDEVYHFLSRHFADSQETKSIMREISKRYLQSDASLEEKTTYLRANFSMIGPEGMVMLGNQIDTMADYLAFRKEMGEHLQKSLNGSLTTSLIAAADFTTSQIPEKDQLFNTCSEDPEESKHDTTNFANKWLQTNFSYMGGFIAFDNKTKTIVVDERERGAFRSFADIISSLKDLTNIQRIAVALKALVDQDGALANSDNKEILAKRVISSLDVNDNFIHAVLKTAITLEDPEQGVGYEDIIAFPVARMIAPLLFNSLDVNSLDFSDISTPQPNWHVDKSKLPDEADLPRILTADTRALLFFGRRFIDDPNSLLARLAGESNDEYYESLRLLRENFPQLITTKIEEGSGSELAPATEAVIKGIETTALGIRTLQLARQLYDFPPAIDRRLSNLLDANPGIEKILLWENLVKLSGEKPEVKDYLEGVVEIKQKLGGGSLYTVFEALVNDGQGGYKRTVIKYLNPNAISLIKKAYALGHDTLEQVKEDTTSPEFTDRVRQRRFADLGLLLLDLSQAWCIKDISDKTFLEDDRNFRQTINEFNQKLGSNVFFAPEIDFNSTDLKSESLSEDPTLNKVLNDDSIEPAIKKQAIEYITRFYAYQMRNQAIKDADGKRHYLLHSDPHPGNFTVKIEDGQIIRIGILDRNMYLNLSDAQIAAVAPLVKEQGNFGFVVTFVNQILELDKERNPDRKVTLMEKLKFGNKFVRELARQYGPKALATGGVDSMVLLRSLFESFIAEGLAIPLELQLAIKNIQAMKELSKRHGFKFEDSFK